MQASNLSPVPGGSPAVERGVGFFETVLAVGGHAILWDSHVRRLIESVRKWRLPAPGLEQIETAKTQALSGLSAKEETALRLTWLAIEPDIENDEAWRLDASVRPIPALTLQRRAGSHAISLTPEFGRDMPELKATSYLAAVLGLRYAAAQGGDEGLFVAIDGSYIEGTATALVAWNEGRPVLSSHQALPSVTAAAMLGPEIRRALLTRPLLLQGAMLVGSLTRAVPILTIDGEACSQPSAMLTSIADFNRQLMEGVFR